MKQAGIALVLIAGVLYFGHGDTLLTIVLFIFAGFLYFTGWDIISEILMLKRRREASEKKQRQEAREEYEFRRMQQRKYQGSMSRPWPTSYHEFRSKRERW